jgi:hypothetical protein
LLCLKNPQVALYVLHCSQRLHYILLLLHALLLRRPGALRLLLLVLHLVWWFMLFYFFIIIVLDLSLRGLLVFILRLGLLVFVGVYVRRFQRWLVLRRVSEFNLAGVVVDQC